MRTDALLLDTRRLATALLLLFLVATSWGAELGVTRISAGDSYSMFVKSDGSLWAMGDNHFGQLGDTTFTTQRIPVQIVGSEVVQVAAGWDHSLFLKAGGSLWTMGAGQRGQLGDGKTQTRNSPLAIVTSGVSDIAAGNSHSLFKSSIGSRLAKTISLSAFGNNQDGQLGDGTTTQREFPQLVRSTQVDLFDFTSIAAGSHHSFFVQRFNRTLFGMGRNTSGQLGDGTIENRLSPALITTDVLTVAAGIAHSLFIKSDGSLWGMGHNAYGQLGDGTTNRRTSPVKIVSSQVVAIAAGGVHSVFIKSDGSLWGMGSNSSGQLGLSTPTNRLLPTLVVPAGVVRVAAGGDHSLLIKSDGSLWGMGANGLGQLGLGGTAYAFGPVPIISPLRPELTGIRLSGSDLLLQGRNGQSNRTYVAYTTSVIELPQSLWRPLSTNQLQVTGDFTVVIPGFTKEYSGPQFYKLNLLD